MHICNYLQIMKQILTRILCLFMAFQVLFASTGFAMIEHLCKVKGRKTFILSSPPKCCPQKMLKKEEKSSKANFKRTKCCEEHSTFVHINTASSNANQVSLNIPIFIGECCSFSPFYTFNWSSEPVSFKVTHYYNTAPPIAGRKLLIHIQSFLI